MTEQREGKPLTTRDMAGSTGNEENHRVRDTRALAEDHQRDGEDSRADRPTPLLDESEAAKVRKRWQDIQTGFVDEPRAAVESADQLVAELMQRLAKMFSDERGQLERQWDRDGNVSTEDMRLAFQRYRSFFDRLLSI
jgi:hypothetical protein